MAYKLTISVTQNSQSIDNNTSNVTVKVNCSWTYGTWSAENKTKYCTIDGVTRYFSNTDINPNQTTSGSSTLYTWTGNISHNSDGTKTLKVFASTVTGTSSGTQTASAEVELTTIPRASTISATAAVVGSQTTITISRKSDNFTHTLSYEFGSLSGTIVSKTSSTSYKWTLPTTFYAQIGATATSKSGTITCKTYNGNTLVGTKTATFTAKTSSATCAPTLSPTVTADSATQALTGNTTTLIRYYSDAKITFGAAARNSATLKSTKVTNSGKSRATDGNITDVTSGEFEFTATDSRGYTTSKTIKNTLVSYVKLTCSFSARLLVDGTGTLTAKGNYFSGSFGAASNTLTLQWRYKTIDGSYGSWENLTPTISGNSYSLTKNLSGYDYQTTYVFQVRAVDKLATATADERNVRALPVFDWGEDDFNFNVPVTMNYNGYSYDLLGLFRAMTTTYTPSCDVTPGENYSSATVTAHLTGCNLRIGLSATRNASLSAGNFSNETVATIDLDHGGKLANLYRVSFNTSTSGGVATLDCQASKVSDSVVRLTINLCAAAQSLTEFNAYFSMPCTIITKAYV